MIKLIYISTARAVPSPAVLNAILKTSNRNNAALGVTGLLVAGGRRFLQALEGPSDAVRQIYGRIECDTRHFAPVILSDEAIAERSFGGWAMGYQPAGSLATNGEIASTVAALIAPIGDPLVHAYFSEFAKKHAA